jgi:hypothetical protein
MIVMREPDIEAIIISIKTEDGGRTHPFFYWI